LIRGKGRFRVQLSKAWEWATAHCHAKPLLQLRALRTTHPLRPGYVGHYKFDTSSIEAT
jgi:hypothetical protein